MRSESINVDKDVGMKAPVLAPFDCPVLHRFYPINESIGAILTRLH